jgi:ABC-type glutathione transport system ATPase component
MSKALLQVEDLAVQYRPEGASEVGALNGVSFAIAPGEVVGLLGESGCGKTTLALSLLRLLPRSARVASGSIRFCGQQVMALNERQLERLRGARISMVFQEPGIALHPMLSVGEQIAEVVRAHKAWNRRRCREEAERMLAEVHLEPAARIYAAYPHQLSGGQRQRVVIAQALACRPDLVIADEPTASLDARVQAEILTLLQELRTQSGIAMLLISHNPAVLARLADRVLVMYAGRIVEQGDLAEIHAHPVHPYTRLLLGEIAERGNGKMGKRTNNLCMGTFLTTEGTESLLTRRRNFAARQRSSSQVPQGG